MIDSQRPVVAFGPEQPGIGSWDWVGCEMAEELGDEFEVCIYGDEIPPCDVAILVKYQPHRDSVFRAVQRSAIVFCPIDAYGSVADIDRDYDLLRCCSRIILHAPSLRASFQSYAAVELLDHHIKHAAPLRQSYRADGPILWTGMRSNLPPLADWVNRHALPDDLLVLTNLQPTETRDARHFGFRGNVNVHVEPWNPQRHNAALEFCRAAIDIKGDDFRQRHKPAAKALDVIASGVPLAMNPGSSSARYVRDLGFELADPADVDRWLSRDYWEATRAFGAQVRERLSRRRIGEQLRQIINSVLSERRVA